MARRGIAVLLLGAVALAAGCDRSPTSTTRAADAEARLFNAMRQDDFTAVGDIIGTMYDIQQSDPTNRRNEFLLGATSFWWVAEANRPGANSLAIISQSIPLVVQTFPDIIQNDPANADVATALFGAFLMGSGFSPTTGDSLVNIAIKRMPTNGYFQRMYTRRLAFVSDTLTAQAVEAGWNFWDTCTGTHVDRANPDFTTLVRPPEDDGNPTRFCWGSARVPHGYEGAWLIFGDLLVKNGQLAAARRAYLNARLGANYATWKYKAVLESRLVEDLSQRQATYNAFDQTTWASIGVPPYECTQCHANASP
ncbi:MAG: hypothetical protein ACHQSE_02920 [Gemmatimonadales bacterium]